MPFSLSGWTEAVRLVRSSGALSETIQLILHDMPLLYEHGIFFFYVHDKKGMEFQVRNISGFPRELKRLLTKKGPTQVRYFRGRPAMPFRVCFKRLGHPMNQAKRA